MKTKSLFVLFFLVLFTFPVEGQNKNYQKVNIRFSQTSLTVKQALGELSKLPDITIIYQGNDSHMAHQIKLPDKSISVQEALNRIEEQAPVEIIYKNGHIIVKSKTLQESYLLEGVIKDAKTNETLIAASVFIRGTSRGTVTDIDGKFTLQLPPDAYELEVRYIGYKNKRIAVTLYEDKSLQVFLEESKQEIGAVEIIGTFGEVQDLKTGRPIENIDSKTINNLNTNVVNDALHGRINGVWTTKTSGAPGDHNKIRIRGINSIFGSTDPLYVVDGVIVPVVNLKSLGIADLNSHDVESITVLKDASSTVLYGYMGGNGVILIETKKGGGETKFNFSVKKGFQWSPNRYPLMNAEEFYSTLYSSDSLIKTHFYTDSPPQFVPKYPEYQDTLAYDDFQDELFQRGEITEYQLSGQGNIKGLGYYLSGNYFTHKGVVVNSKYDKYSFTANLSKIFGEKLSLRLLYKGCMQENENNLDNYLGNSIIYKGANYEPGYRSTNQGFFHIPERLYFNGESEGTMEQLSNHLYSPDSLFYGQSKRKTEISNAFNFHGKYQLTSNLSFHAGLSLAFRNMLYKSYLPRIEGEESEKYLSSDEHFVVFNQQYDLRYKKLFSNHSISGFFRFRTYKDNVYWKIDSTKHVEIDGLRPEDDIYLRGSQAIYGELGSSLRALSSGILNLNYSYKNKYTFSAILNYDNLREGDHVDNNELFYSLAFEYDMYKEQYLSFPKWINGFHWYVNIGHVGNYPLNSLTKDLYSQKEYEGSGQLDKAIITHSLSNHYLKHEEITEYNFGAEMAFLKNRIILSANFYLKNYTDLLMRRIAPYYYIGGFYYQNIGEMRNQGIELSLEITPIEVPGFIWTTKFGFSANKQVITKLLDGETISFISKDILIPDFHINENETLGAIYGYEFLGPWDDSIHSVDVNNGYKYARQNGIAYPNHDSTTSYWLTDGDKTIIGQSIPDFTCNWINLIRYKNFTCEMFWYAVYGVDKFNATKACTYITGTNSEVRQLVRDSKNFHTADAVYESSYFVEDASFIRLKTLTFRYHQPKKILNRIGMEYSISFENLVTLTRYSGYDPEATIYTNNNFSDNAIDKGAYPNPKGVYLSLSLNF